MTERSLTDHRWDNDGELILTGSANAYVAATGRQIAGYYQGLRICGKANFTNTGAVTLNVNNIGAAAVRKLTSVALVAGDMVSGQYYDFVYDFTNGWFQLLNPSFDGGAFVLKAGDTMTGNLTINQTTSGNSSLIIIGGQSGVGNPNIELGRVDGTTSSPHIDFHSGATAVDYDARIIGSGGTGVQGGGTLNVQAANFQFNANAIVAPASPAQGDVIYYNGTSWVRLAAGTSGNFLQTLGAGANPSWATLPATGGITTIASGSFPAAATLSFTSIPATYAYLFLSISGASSNTATRQPLVRLSTNNGSSYDATAPNYSYLIFDITTPIAEAQGTLASLIQQPANSAATTYTAQIEIFNYQGGPNMMWRARSTDSSTAIVNIYRGIYLGSTSAINAIQILWNLSGNFDAGTYALYGIS